mmetsp:Transcript_15681/g.33140  ORF Transcript_15681/g.33140 Transcript_15681/m.33140 type:complete len:445 (-) Transcript_15681:168-1502(-)
MYSTFQIHQYLRGLWEAIVILRRHSCAVRATPVHNGDVPDVGSAKDTFVQGLWLTGFGGHEITRFAAVSDNDNTFSGSSDIFGLTRCREDCDGVDCSVERRTENIGHTSVHFKVDVTIINSGRFGRYLVLNRRYECSGISDQIRSRFNLQGQLPPMLLRKFLECILNRRSNLSQISSFLIRIPPHLVPPSQIQRRNRIPKFAEAQALPRHALPNGRITSRTDVGVDAFGLEAVLFDNSGNGAVGEVLVPDAEGRGRSTDVGFGEAGGGGGETSRSDSGVDADAYFLGAVGEGLAETFKLGYGASINLHAHVDQLRKILRQLLRTQTDILRRYSHIHRPTNFETTTGIDANSPTRKIFQNTTIGTRLHGVSNSKSIGVGEGKNAIGSLGELIERVGVERRAGSGVDAGLGEFGCEEVGRAWRGFGAEGCGGGGAVGLDGCKGIRG